MLLALIGGARAPTDPVLDPPLKNRAKSLKFMTHGHFGLGNRMKKARLMVVDAPPSTKKTISDRRE